MQVQTVLYYRSSWANLSFTRAGLSYCKAHKPHCELTSATEPRGYSSARGSISSVVFSFYPSVGVLISNSRNRPPARVCIATDGGHPFGALDGWPSSPFATLGFWPRICAISLRSERFLASDGVHGRVQADGDLLLLARLEIPGRRC